MRIGQSVMTAETGQPPEQGDQVQARGRRSGWKLYLLILLCVAPVIGSYLAYYVFPPAERTNYGMLIEPQRPVPAIAADLVQAPATAPGSEGVRADSLADEGLAAMRGRWLMLAIDRGECAHACAEKLYFMRQTQASLGRERGRLQRVLLVTDAAPLPQRIREAHPDLVVLRASRAALDALFPVEADTSLADHIYLIDPLHNLMMRFPRNPDPGATRKDLQKLLKASRIG
jgi:hypothetical protein